MTGSAGTELFPCKQGHYGLMLLCSFSTARLHLLRPGSGCEARVTGSVNTSRRALHAAWGAGPPPVSRPAELWCSHTRLPAPPGRKGCGPALRVQGASSEYPQLALALLIPCVILQIMHQPDLGSTGERKPQLSRGWCQDSWDSHHKNTTWYGEIW